MLVDQPAVTIPRPAPLLYAAIARGLSSHFDGPYHLPRGSSHDRHEQEIPATPRVGHSFTAQEPVERLEALRHGKLKSEQGGPPPFICVCLAPNKIALHLVDKRAHGRFDATLMSPCKSPSTANIDLIMQ
ncbi:hypothetical protein PG993_009656 [Apiospora rasikravindrae]|uniref:Uncharacterized protein n=1 Tax=Apiospora rasikravindrae TaxID=990691 RepID=A0ABR1SK03_9PEZI